MEDDEERYQQKQRPERIDVEGEAEIEEEEGDAEGVAGEAIGAGGDQGCCGEEGVDVGAGEFHAERGPEGEGGDRDP